MVLGIRTSCLCIFSPWRTHRTLCVGSAVLVFRPPLLLVTCAWPGNGHLTAAANPGPEIKKAHEGKTKTGLEIDLSAVQIQHPHRK